MRHVLCLIAALLAGLADAAAQSSGRLVGSVHEVSVAAGMTLRAVGSREGVDPRVIAADSGIKLNAVLRVGTVLRIDNRHIVPAGLEPRTIVVNVPQRMLFYTVGELTTGAPVAVGRASWRTPVAAFSIVIKETDPTWDVPISIQEEARRAGKSLPAVVLPGLENPLGKYWLGLSIGGVGIHGTNAPASVYQVITHGCIRMHPDDIAWLFEHVAVSARGRTIYEPVQLLAQDGEVFLEVHPDVYRIGPVDVPEFVRRRAADLGVQEVIDWGRAQQVIGERDGIARRITR